MSLVTIIDSSLSHVRELSRNLQQADQEECLALGIQPNRALYKSFQLGLYRKTALIDSRVAAMWGVVGTPLSMSGQPYLLTSPLVQKISPLKFTRIYKQEVEEMKRLFPVLENFVDARYLAAVRLLELAGFTISSPMKIRDNWFYKFTMVNE